MKQFNFVAEPGAFDVTITCTFDAPIDLVCKVLLDPILIPQWWGPEYFKTVVDKMEVRSGGSWRFVQYGPDGKEFAFHGVYHTVNPPKQLVFTMEFEGAPGSVSLVIATFDEKDGKTKMVEKTIFQSIEDRDRMIGWQMEAGKSESIHRLTQLLTKMSKNY